MSRQPEAPAARLASMKGRSTRLETSARVNRAK